MQSAVFSKTEVLSINSGGFSSIHGPRLANITCRPSSQNPYKQFTLAKSFFKNGDYDEALKHINNAVNLTQDEGRFYALRGKILFKRGDYEGAIEDLSKALVLLQETIDSNGEAWSESLHTTHQCLFDEDAKKRMNAAIRASAQVHFDLSLIHYRLNNKETCYEYICNACALDTKIAKQYYKRGKCVMDLSEEIEGAIKQIIELNKHLDSALSSSELETVEAHLAAAQNGVDLVKKVFPTFSCNKLEHLQMEMIGLGFIADLIKSMLEKRPSKRD